MNPTLRVAVARDSSPEFLASERAVWATLPMSLTETTAEPPQLVAVDGGQPDWPSIAAAAATLPVRGVLVVHPYPGPSGAEVRELAARVRAAGVVVAVESRWAAHPAVAQVADLARERLPEVALVDGLATVAQGDTRSAAAILLDQLALLRVVHGPVDEVSFSAFDGGGYTVNGHHGATAVVLSAVRCSATEAGARLTLYAAAGEAHLEVVADGNARPALASLVDGQGESVLPSWYESASRASWRRLLDSVATEANLSDLESLADDLDCVAGVT